jgi:hypothetical protein
MIINNFNVWQPPVAKHWPITSVPPTTTIPPSLRHRCHCHSPRKCPIGPSKGVLIVTNCYVTAAATCACAADDEPHTPCHRHRWAPHAMSLLTTTTGHHSTLPLPSSRDVGAMRAPFVGHIITIAVDHPVDEQEGR